MDNEIRESMVAKLHPSVIKSSALMHFIIGTIAGEEWVTHPRAGSAFSITSDGYVNCGSVFIGSADDFERNCNGYVQVAELTSEERALWDMLYKAKVSDFRRPRRTRS